MRKVFISYEMAPNLCDAETLAPWAAEIFSADGGWMCFESADDADMWQAQQ